MDICEIGGPRIPGLTHQGISDPGEDTSGEWVLSLPRLSHQDLCSPVASSHIRCCHSIPGLEYQGLSDPVEATRGRGVCSFPIMTPQHLSGFTKASHGSEAADSPVLLSRACLTTWRLVVEKEHALFET